MATVFPLEGAVPNAQGLQSPDDPMLRASVLSRWPDGSASVAIVAGEAQLTAGTTKFIRLQAGPTAGTSLTPARVGQLVTNVTVDCGALGSAVINDFSSPAKTWWANERVICCRYRAPVGGHATLEAVIDIHAFASNRAFVEIVVENCKMNSSAPIKPSSVSYASSVTVNGTSVASVSTAAAPGGTHQAFRAWHVSTWVGGDPGIEVTHDTDSMQAHPMMNRMWKTSDQNLQALYQNDAYEPWSTERLNVPGMSATGDHAAIGHFTDWDSRYLQSGNKYVRRATIASALAALTCNINYRDSTTGLVPTFDEIGTRDYQHTGSLGWPIQDSEPGWEHAHSPAVGLMAFLCRPSPCFIEIAQRAGVWQSLWGNAANGVLRGSYQVRGKAWTLRAWNHALFVTPDADAWKEPCRTKIFSGLVNGIEPYKNLASNKLGIGWRYDAPGFASYEGSGAASGAGGSDGLWQWHFCIVELHKIAATKALRGTQHTKAVEIADWAAAGPIRYINESVAGEWRMQPYTFTHSRSPTAIDPLDTWGQQWAWAYGTPPALSGPWIQSPAGNAWAAPTEGISYDAQNWAAICIGVERGVPGADAAWSKVNTNITNLTTWSSGFASAPRWGFYPRNK